MAYQPEAFDPNKLAQLKSRAAELEGSLSASPTARAPGTAPTIEDLANEASSKALGKEIEVLQGKQLAEKWYGKGRDEETFKGEGTQQSPLMRGLNALSVPLYATAGLVEGALGKGSKKGILDNVTANVKEKEGFGNILRRSGVPYAASMPIGFALDVAFDPLNWATAGTAALIPRIGVGLAKGGLHGATKGAVSRLAPMGVKTANILSLGGISRAQNTAKALARNSGVVPSKLTKFSALVGNTSKKIGEAGADAASKYDELIGKEMTTSKSGVKYAKDMLREKGPGYYWGGEKYSIGDSAERLIKDFIPNGENLVHTFKYSPANWLRLKRIESEMIQNADEIKGKTGFEFIPKTQETRWKSEADIPEEVKAGIIKHVDQVDQNAAGNSEFTRTMGFDETSPNTGGIATVFNDGIDVAENVPTYAQAENSAEIIKRLGGEAMNDVTAEDVIKIANRWEAAKTMNKTGVQWYDNMNQHLRNFKIKNTHAVAKLMDAYSSYITAFKLAKIGLTPAAHMNAVLGNTTMIKMAGIDVENPQMIALISRMANLSRQKGPAAEKLLKELFDDPAWLEYAKKDKLGFSGTFNFSLDDLARRDEELDTYVSALAKNATKKGGMGKDKADELLGNKELQDKIKEQIAMVKPPVPGHEEYASYVLNEIKDTPNAVNDLGSKVARMVREEAERVKRIHTGKAIPGDELKIAGAGTKALDLAMNKSMDAFGAIDPIFRIGTAVHLTKNGLSEAEMNIVSRMFGVSKDDILDVVKDSVTGERRFKITPAKATEMAGEIFLNYSAMPAAVKMLRTLPILGAPFASFAYGMTARTGKTALYNPAIFNKTNFLLQEISGDKDPLEKKAMESKYYSWFNDPGMVKMPFVKKFPLYANVTNMIPYYSMNMFTPSERKYGETLPDSVMSFLDKFPILQDPAGQVMFDYMIQPLLISKGATPQGAFGQALYPKDATGLEKFGYATRQLAEGVTPGIAGLGALATAPLTSTGEHINYVPSYRYRQLANAIKGKTVLGIPSKEPASSRSLRTVGSMFGLPTHRMDTSFTEQETKKTIKKAQ